MIKVKRVAPGSSLPKYANPGDAGMDLYAAEDLVLGPGDIAKIRTGIAVAIPQGYVGLIWDKSSIAAQGVKTMGGVIDAGYRGEVMVVAKNLGNTPFSVRKNTKIAQMLIQPVEQRNVVEVEELDATVRGEGGFGSTGKE